MDESSNSTSPTPNDSGNNPPKVFVWGAIVVILVTIALIGYRFVTEVGSGNQTGLSTIKIVDEKIDTSSPTETQSLPQGTSEELPVIEIEGGSFYFKPNIIQAKVGQTVKVKFTSVGGMPHDFVVDEFGVNTKEIADDTLEVEFTPDKAGNFEFYCSVGNHRSMGMKGTLVVEE